MSYTLKKVEHLLKKAFDRAKDQIENDQTKKSDVKLGEDIGHAKAFQYAENALLVPKANDIFRDRVIRRGKLRKRLVLKNNAKDMFDQKQVWEIHVPDTRQPYTIFLLRCRLYLVQRGIPFRLKHKTAIAQFLVNSPTGGRRMKKIKLYVSEEALRSSGILLRVEKYKKPLAEKQGSIKTPWSGTVEKAIRPPPSNGGKFVREGDPLFVIKVWVTPSTNELKTIKSPVNGSVETVFVKVGDRVEEGRQLIQLARPNKNTSPF